MSSISFDKNLLPEFDSIKDNGEEILWIGKPRFIPYLLSNVLRSLFVMFIGMMILVTGPNAKVEGAEDGPNYFWLIGLLPLAQGLYTLLKHMLSYRNTLFALSNRRVMIRSGGIRSSFITIAHNKILDIEVKVNMADRRYNVGTIRFFSGRTKEDEDGISNLYDNWYAIDAPYEIFEQVKRYTGHNIQQEKQDQ